MKKIPAFVLIFLLFFSCKPAPDAAKAEELFKSGVILSMYTYYAGDLDIQGITKSADHISFSDVSMTDIIPGSLYNKVNGNIYVKDQVMETNINIRNTESDYDVYFKLPYSSLETEAFTLEYKINGHPFLFKGVN